MCFIINRPLCRHVLSSQHITLTCTGGILPQFYFFFFLTKDGAVDGLKKGRNERGLGEDGWWMEYESELREGEKRQKERGMAEKDVGIC